MGGGRISLSLDPGGGRGRGEGVTEERGLQVLPHLLLSPLFHLAVSKGDDAVLEEGGPKGQDVDAVIER